MLQLTKAKEILFLQADIRPQISAFCPKEEVRTSSSGTRTKQTMRDYRQANFVQDPYFTGKVMERLSGVLFCIAH